MRDVTFQWNIISESLHRSNHPKGPHGMGLLMVEALLALEGCRCISLGTQVPVTIGAAIGGEVVVNPGDYVLADRSAVIFISPEHIERVLEAAEMIVAKEAAMAKAILAGTPMGEVMGGNYEHLLEN